MELTADTVSEAVERARLELLRQGHWDELRESERVTRVEVLRTAMEAAGVIAALDELRTKADGAAGLAAELAEQRESARRVAAEHDREIVRLADEIAELKAALLHEESARLAAEGRAARVDAALDQVRAALAAAGTGAAGADGAGGAGGESLSSEQASGPMTLVTAGAASRAAGVGGAGAQVEPAPGGLLRRVLGHH